MVRRLVARNCRAGGLSIFYSASSRIAAFPHRLQYNLFYYSSFLGILYFIWTKRLFFVTLRWALLFIAEHDNFACPRRFCRSIFSIFDILISFMEFCMAYITVNFPVRVGKRYGKAGVYGRRVRSLSSSYLLFYFYLLSIYISFCCRQRSHFIVLYRARASAYFRIWVLFVILFHPSVLSYFLRCHEKDTRVKPSFLQTLVILPVGTPVKLLQKYHRQPENSKPRTGRRRFICWFTGFWFVTKNIQQRNELDFLHKNICNLSVVMQLYSSAFF